MVSLTPQSKKEEVSSAAAREGFINAAMVFVPTYGLFLLAMKKSPNFVKYTRWQSRTSLILLPPCFTFAYTSERALQHKMHELANYNEHLRETAIWADQKHAELKRMANEDATSSASSSSTTTNTVSSSTTASDKPLSEQQQLMALYRESVAGSGVRIVPEMKLYHKFANFWQDHPLRILIAAGIPAVGYIYYGRAGQQHLPQSIKIMHTRVMGQFAVITLLLGLIGIKGYMDQYGQFISVEEADRRAMEMADVREGLLQRIQTDKEQQAEIESLLKKAHDEDVKTGHVHEKKKKGKKQHETAMSEVASV